jgi:hypothetical protein
LFQWFGEADKYVKAIFLFGYTLHHGVQEVYPNGTWHVSSMVKKQMKIAVKSLSSQGKLFFVTPWPMLPISGMLKVQ